MKTTPTETIGAKDEKTLRQNTPAPQPWSRPVTSHQPSRKYIYKQHLAAFIANLLSFSSGIALGWSSPAVPVLRGLVEDPQPLRLSLEQGSWVSALMPLTSLVGAAVSGPLAERIGRKGALLVIAVPKLLGWLLMTFSGSSLLLLMVGRSLTGIAAGAVHCPVALYCEEFADVRIRGRLGSYHYLMTCLGVNWACAAGSFLPYFWFNALSLFPTVVFLLTFCWMPESPAYLIVKGRPTEAHRSLQWFRGDDIDFDHELEALVASKIHQSSNDRPKTSFSSSLRRPWRSTALRSLAVLLTLAVLQQMCGFTLFLFHAVQAFQEADRNISAYLSCVFSAVANFVGVFLSFLVVDRVGRRFLFFVSSLVSGICLIALCVYSYLNSHGSVAVGWTWIPAALIMVYLVTYSVGLGPVPWFLMAELLPMHAKRWAPPIVVCTNRFLMFIVAKQSPLMLEYAGQIPTYATFSVFCLLSAIFVFLCVPETKGKSKLDILNKIGGDRP